MRKYEHIRAPMSRSVNDKYTLSAYGYIITTYPVISDDNTVIYLFFLNSSLQVFDYKYTPHIVAVAE